MSTALSSPVYTLGTWQGNVRDDYGVDWIVETEDGWSSSPPVRAVVEERQSADGGWNGPGWYASRVVTLSGKALADSRVSMLSAKERLKAAITPRDRVDLVVEEKHLSRRAQVRLSDTIEIADWGAHAFNWSLIVVAADPRRYALTPVSTSTTLPSAAASGRTYPHTYPRTYGGGGGSGRVFVANDGDFDQTPAVISISGPVANPRVAHLQSGRSLGFAITLTSAEYLQIDLLTRQVLLNGTASRASSIIAGSAWFMLARGLNELQFRGAAVTEDPDPTPPVMTVTAASAWT